MLLSERSKIPVNERLIVALDFADIRQAMNLVDQLGTSVTFYKVGLELLMSGKYFDLINWLAKKNKKVFADLKLFDIPQTVGKAVKNLSCYDNISFLTIHAASKEIMISAAENKRSMKILAVTVLTSLDQSDLSDMGFSDDVSLEKLALKRSFFAKECGVEGVVSSVLEAKEIRKQNGQNFLIVTPGIRLNKIPGDDQKRVADVKTAFFNGSDYIVIGRPINTSKNPKESAEEFQRQINLFRIKN